MAADSPLRLVVVAVLHPSNQAPPIPRRLLLAWTAASKQMREPEVRMIAARITPLFLREIKEVTIKMATVERGEASHS
jgi:hypothetical protein